MRLDNTTRNIIKETVASQFGAETVGSAVWQYKPTLPIHEQALRTGIIL